MSHAVLDTIRTRRVVRSLSDEPVERAQLKHILASFQNAGMTALHFRSGIRAEVNITCHFAALEATFRPFCALFRTESPKKCKAISGHPGAV